MAGGRCLLSAGRGAMGGERIDDDEFERQLTALKRHYVAHLPGKWDEIAALAVAVARDASADAARGKIARIHEIAHILSGSGGTYGAVDVSAAAAEVERKCSAILESDAAASGANWRDIERRLGRLKEAIDAFVREEQG
jgi:hypothetical protein